MNSYLQYKNSGIDPIGEIPAGWKTVHLRGVFTEVNDKYVAANDEPLPLLSVSEYYGVAERADKINDDEILIRASTLDGYKKCKQYDFVSNIMLAWKCAMGVCPKDGIVSPAYCVYRFKEGFNPFYYHYLLRTPSYGEIYKQHSTGIIDSRLRLYTDEFFSLYVPVPPLPEQSAIASYLDDKVSQIDTLIAEAKASIEEYKAWKASIIYEAVTKGLDKGVEMKDSGVEWIGKIPADCQIIKTKSLASRIVVGVVVKPADYFDENGTVPFLRGLNVKEYSIVPEPMVHINAETNKLLEKSIVHTDDLLIIRDGSIGTTCIVPPEYDGANVVSMIIVTCSEGVSPQFLCYSFNSHVGKIQFDRTKIGSALTHTSVHSVSSIFHVIPSYAEQLKIVEYLDGKCNSINSLISEKESLITDLEAYKKSLIFEVVTGKRKVG